MPDSAQWTSALTAGEQAALAGVGFSPVGQVLGASVWSLNQTGRGNCGRYGGYGYGAGSYRTGPVQSFASGYAASAGLGGVAAHVGRARTQHMQVMGNLVDTYTRARRSALRRLQQEAAALGADGVVGVRLAVEPFVGSVQRSLSFVAVGTAVRSAGGTHLAGPFMCDLSGDDLSLLLRSGWAPTGLAMGVGAVVAHDTYMTVRTRRSWAGNQELMVYSDLATQARMNARARLNEDVRLHSGEAAVLGSMTVSVHRQKCRSGTNNSPDDHFVEVVMLGTAITRFSSGEAPPASGLTMIRLSRRPGRPAVARSTVLDPFTHRRGS